MAEEAEALTQPLTVALEAQVLEETVHQPELLLEQQQALLIRVVAEAEQATMVFMTLIEKVLQAAQALQQGCVDTLLVLPVAVVPGGLRGACLTTATTRLPVKGARTTARGVPRALMLVRWVTWGIVRAWTKPVAGEIGLKPVGPQDLHR